MSTDRSRLGGASRSPSSEDGRDDDDDRCDASRSSAVDDDETTTTTADEIDEQISVLWQQRTLSDVMESIADVSLLPRSVNEPSSSTTTTAAAADRADRRYRRDVSSLSSFGSEVRNELRDHCVRLDLDAVVNAARTVWNEVENGDDDDCRRAKDDETMLSTSSSLVDELRRLRAVERSLKKSMRDADAKNGAATTRRRRTAADVVADDRLYRDDDDEDDNDVVVRRRQDGFIVGNANDCCRANNDPWLSDAMRRILLFCRPPATVDPNNSASDRARGIELRPLQVRVSSGGFGSTLDM